MATTVNILLPTGFDNGVAVVVVALHGAQASDAGLGPTHPVVDALGLAQKIDALTALVLRPPPCHA